MFWQVFIMVIDSNLDISFLTVHGKSKYPGLFVWFRDGQKAEIKIPDGCFFVQAAKQLEILTGGYVFAGMHEVIVTEEAIKLAKKAKEESKYPWRVSTTMFTSIRYDEYLEPLDKFKNKESIMKYPNVKVVDQVAEELKSIDLLKF